MTTEDLDHETNLDHETKRDILDHPNMDPVVVRDMRARTPQGWYGLATPKGWDTIVEATHKALFDIDPDYKIHQIKEKFGTLRYYSSLGHSETKGIMRVAEWMSARTCQQCGSTNGARMCSLGYWVATMCKPCFVDEVGDRYATATETQKERGLGCIYNNEFIAEFLNGSIILEEFVDDEQDLEEQEA